MEEDPFAATGSVFGLPLDRLKIVEDAGAHAHAHACAARPPRSSPDRTASARSSRARC